MPTASSSLQSFQPQDNGGRELGGILERISDALVALDKNWCYTYVNQRAADLFGRRPEDLIGKNIWVEFPEGKGQPFHLAYEKAMSEQVFVEMENYYEPWQRWFENRIYPSDDGLSIFFHEITERKRAEQAAHESARLLNGQNEVLELIARGAPLQDTLSLLLHVIETQSPGMLCSILLLDPDGIHLRHGAAPSLPKGFTRAIDGKRIGPNAGSCGTAAFLGEPVVVEDIATHPLWQDYRDAALEHGLRACWSTPIFDAQQRVLGTFALYFRNVTRPDQRRRELIDMATQTAAIAIVKHKETEALRASEELLRLAVTGGNVGIWEWVLQQQPPRLER
jgi:PAS domain S-box-containing protein